MHVAAMDTTDAGTGDLLRETAARVFAPHCETATLHAAEQGIWPISAFAALEEAGFLRAMAPESAGGFGIDLADALSLLKVAGAYALPLPLAETMLASWLLAGAGLDIPDGVLTVAPNPAPYLPPFPVGDSLVLARDGGSWRLSGSASRIPWAGQANAVAMLVEAEGEIRVALARQGGWRREAGENIAREPRDALHFDNVEVQCAVSPLGMVQFRAVGAAMRAQQMAGALERLTSMTTQYAQDRVQFGRPIGKFQAVQQNLAVLAGQAAAASAAADWAAEAVADGVRLLPIAAAKARVGEAAGIGAAIAHQVHGAIGFTAEHNLHFLTKRLWSWRDEFGNEAEWNRLVGRHMAEAGPERLWSEIVAA
jgi:acyl-CoA dehydrogenase